MRMRGPRKKILGPHRRALVHDRQVMGLHMKVHGGRRKEEPHSLFLFPHWEQRGAGEEAGRSQGGGGEHLDGRDEEEDEEEQEDEMGEGVHLLQGREAGSQ